MLQTTAFIAPFEELLVKENGAIIAIVRLQTESIKSSYSIVPSNFFGFFKRRLAGIKVIRRLAKQWYFFKILESIEQADQVFIHNDIDLAEFLQKRLPLKALTLQLHNDVADHDVPRLRKFRNLVVCSEFLRTRLAKYGCRAEVLCNPISKEIELAIKDSKPFGQRRFNYAFIGRFDDNKGFERVLSAMNKRQGVWLVVEAPSPRSIRQLVLRFKLWCLSSRGDVRYYYNLSREELVGKLLLTQVLVVPTKYNEAFGNVALEGLLCGCTVLTSKVGGLADLDTFNFISLDDFLTAREVDESILTVLGKAQNDASRSLLHRHSVSVYKSALTKLLADVK